ncbi:hypothetical protein C7212DRAFT_365176 [Tuber magnatum]|uniref:Biogenesis of lysosome-related organelles complex 1 subunit CNL1 n=1 Tax=Tuber magnatum TaxID=42249 RepID=A0A317SIM3_9PEZI|nr:hypothetical protein C7212DRAFT_365176 [Tuber magnatum]
MSDTSMVPESTLPLCSSEVRAHELELRERPEPEVQVQVPATQAAQVTVRLEDEVHDIRDDVRRLATRFDGLEERFDGLERTMQAQFDQVKGWCEGVAKTLGEMMGQLADIRRSVGPAG